jgi:hypothetical protein
MAAESCQRSEGIVLVHSLIVLLAETTCFFEEITWADQTMIRSVANTIVHDEQTT